MLSASARESLRMLCFQVFCSLPSGVDVQCAAVGGWRTRCGASVLAMKSAVVGSESCACKCGASLKSAKLSLPAMSPVCAKSAKLAKSKWQQSPALAAPCQVDAARECEGKSQRAVPEPQVKCAIVMPSVCVLRPSFNKCLFSVCAFTCLVGQSEGLSSVATLWIVSVLFLTVSCSHKYLRSRCLVRLLSHTRFMIALLAVESVLSRTAAAVSNSQVSLMKVNTKSASQVAVPAAYRSASPDESATVP